MKARFLLTVTGRTSLMAKAVRLFGRITLMFLGSLTMLAMLAAWKQNRGWQPEKNGERWLFLLPASMQILFLNPARGAMEFGPVIIRLCLILLWLRLCRSRLAPLLVL